MDGAVRRCVHTRDISANIGMEPSNVVPLRIFTVPKRRYGRLRCRLWYFFVLFYWTLNSSRLLCVCFSPGRKMWTAPYYWRPGTLDAIVRSRSTCANFCRVTRVQADGILDPDWSSSWGQSLIRLWRRCQFTVRKEQRTSIDYLCCFRLAMFKFTDDKKIQISNIIGTKSTLTPFHFRCLASTTNSGGFPVNFWLQPC